MNNENDRIVVLISGSGSNLQALIDTVHNDLKKIGKIAAVISNKPGVLGLKRAEKAGIPTHVLSHRGFNEREAYDAELLDLIERYQPKLVVLAGFMRILSANFVEHFLGRLLNIHPSLLPKYKGLHTHKRALAAGDKEQGASVHFVTPALDGGPVVAQSRCEIMAGDSEAYLAKRVQGLEHALYPKVVSWFMQNQLQWRDHEVWLMGEKLSEPEQVE
ncbi:phosphoribosylglycinamide formyltransferase [Piscirickettsia litoralis]|uniref:Phosphoribosylglycinamide formyltransferase n=1 Tax=Piscirickettsia litoralis TaxID=1891921 RepID=A0ABX3A735_9GAMM|nr:phosphoribosylglycinamide formyltransferase [Piscirickettsia litoralis]ODN43506.1 phosphoribosylglycinamide formyltransferase [Piscirickettsia litoralis]